MKEIVESLLLCDAARVSKQITNLCTVILPPYPSINVPKAKQRKHCSTIEYIFILRSSAFNKPYRITTQSQRISRVQNLPLSILQRKSVYIQNRENRGRTLRNPRCSTRLSSTAIPRPINSSNCPSVRFKKSPSRNIPSSLVRPAFVRIRLVVSYGFSGVAD